MKIKNLFSLFAVLVLTFGWVKPALAATRSKIDLLYSPTSAYQGENVEVSFKVTKKGGKPEKWQVAIPKSTVSYVSDPGLKGLSLSETSTDYVLTFSLKSLRDRQEIVVNLALRSDIQSSYPLVTLYNGNGDLVEQRMIEVLVPQLIWAIEAPNTVFVNSPYQIKVSINNPTTVDLPLNFTFEYWFTCSQNNPQITYPEGIDVYFDVNQWRHVTTWTGTVASGQTLQWTYDVVAKPYPMTSCGVFLARENSGREDTKYINFVK